MTITLFNNRIGPKHYLAVMPVLFAFLLLAPTFLEILPATLLAAAFVTRLNDIGWPRWHALWLMGWAVLAKLILMAPLNPAISLHDKQQAFALVSWPFLAVALLLAVPWARRMENRGGPPPLGWREFWRARAANKAYLKAFRKSEPAIQALMGQMRAAQEINSRLSAEYKAELARVGDEGARAKRAEVDAAREKFDEILARVTAAQDDLRSRREAAWSSRQANGQANRQAPAARVRLRRGHARFLRYAPSSPRGAVRRDSQTC